MLEVAPWDGLPRELSWKEKIAYLGVVFERLAPEHRASEQLEHSFGHGLYIRKMRIPANTIFLGREHLQGHEVTLLQGAVILITPENKRRFHAVKTIHTTPGFHTVCYTLTDVIAQTVHANPGDCEDIPALEAKIFGAVEELRTLGLAVQDRLRLAAA